MNYKLWAKKIRDSVLILFSEKSSELCASLTLGKNNHDAYKECTKKKYSLYSLWLKKFFEAKLSFFSLKILNYMRKNSIIKLLSACLLFASCSYHVSSTNISSVSIRKTAAVNSPPCIIYRTRSDYSIYIPVMLSSDKTKVESYPDIRDVYYQGKFSLPTLLAGDFLLDNRGIGPQVAFLSYTYEEYSKLSSTPPATDLMQMLLDKNPLIEMYQCGQRSQYTDIEHELNILITSGKLNTCMKSK